MIKCKWAKPHRLYEKEQTRQDKILCVCPFCLRLAYLSVRTLCYAPGRYIWYLLCASAFYSALMDSTGFLLAARITGSRVATTAVSIAMLTTTTVERKPKLNTEAPMSAEM